MPNIFSQGMRQIGQYTTGNYTVPADATGIIITCSRNNLGNVFRNRNSSDSQQRLVADILLERSVNGGDTWEGQGGMAFEGGDFYYDFREDTPSMVNPASWYRVWFPRNLVGTGFLLRGVYEIFERYRGGVDVEFLTAPLPAEPEVHHSVAVETAAFAEVNGATNLTLPSTGMVGSDKCAVFCGANAYTAGRNYTSVTRGGSEVFNELQDTTWGSNQGQGAHHYDNPADAAATTVVVHSGTCVGGGCVYYCTGVHGTSILDSQAINNTSGESCGDTLTSENDGMLVDCCQVYEAPDLDPTAGGQVEDWQNDQFAGGPQIYHAGSHLPATGATVTNGWAWTGDDYWSLTSVSLKPVGAAPSDNAKPLIQRTRLQPLVGGGLTQ